MTEYTYIVVGVCAYGRMHFGHPVHKNEILFIQLGRTQI